MFITNRIIFTINRRWTSGWGQIWLRNYVICNGYVTVNAVHFVTKNGKRLPFKR